MKNLFTPLFVILFSVTFLNAAPKVTATPATKKNSQKQIAESAGTAVQHDFEDMLVQGKFHFADEAVSTVEEDKVLDSLIGVRTHFKDRLQQSAGSF